jgi:hypothetical protein
MHSLHKQTLAIFCQQKCAKSPQAVAVSKNDDNSGWKCNSTNAADSMVFVEGAKLRDCDTHTDVE